MLKTKEFRIGTIVIVALIIAYYGTIYLKNNGLTQSKQHLFFTYHTSIGFQVNMPLVLNGTPVGKIENINPIDNQYRKFLFKLSVINGVKIPKNSTLNIEKSLLKNNQLILELGNAEMFLKSLDTISVSNDFFNTKDDIKSLMNKTGDVSDSINALISNFNKIMDVPIQKQIHMLINTSVVISKNLQQITETFLQSQHNIEQSFKNINSFTNNLNNQNENIQKTIKNLNDLGQTLNNIPLKQMANDLDSSITKIKNASNKLNQKESTLGMLLNDKYLYENLEMSTKNLNALLVDIKTNPSRYVNFSVFNKPIKSKDTVGIK